MVKFALRAALVLLILSGGYYFFFLVPQKKARESLAERSANLVQNRLAFVALTKLDPKNPSFNAQKDSLVASLKNTNKKGLEIAKEDKEKNIFERQNKLLEKVFVTKSYDDGLAVLTSQEALGLLADQTNLILAYQFQLAKLPAWR